MELTITCLGEGHMTDEISAISQRHCRGLVGATWYPSGSKFIISVPDSISGADGKTVDQYADVLRAFGNIMDSLKNTVRETHGLGFTGAIAFPS